MKYILKLSRFTGAVVTIGAALFAPCAQADAVTETMHLVITGDPHAGTWDASREKGGGTVTVDDKGATAKVSFAATSAEGYQFVGTIDCKSVMRQ